MKDGINVLSLFDGISCGQIALERAGIKVDNYYASEIDKYAIQVAKHNYRNTKHIGDVTQVKIKTLYLSEVMYYINGYDTNIQSKISEWEMLYWLDKKFTMSAKVGTQKPNEGQEVQRFASLQCVKEIRFSNNSLGSINKVQDVERSRANGDAGDYRESFKLQCSGWWYDYEIYPRNLQENIRKSKGSTEDRGSEKENIRNIEKKISRRKREDFSFKENQKSNVDASGKKEILGWSEEDKLRREVKEEKRNRREEKISYIEKIIRELQRWDEVDGIKKNYWSFLRLHKEEQVTVVEYDEGFHVFKGRIDLFCGGSPCQGFSFAGKQLNFDDPQSKLFFEFVRLLKECKPQYFLLENVKMKKKDEQVITDALGVEATEINSSLFSMQNRKRLYWTNIPILQFSKVNEDCFDGYLYRLGHGYIKDEIKFFKKYPTLAAQSPATKYRIVIDLQKATDALKSNNMDVLRRGNSLTRSATPEECEKLQTLPNGYTSILKKRQRYKCIGNGWTVDVIAHIFKGLIDWDLTRRLNNETGNFVLWW